jgi:hypothetical protein
MRPCPIRASICLMLGIQSPRKWYSWKTGEKHPLRQNLVWPNMQTLVNRWLSLSLNHSTVTTTDIRNKVWYLFFPTFWNVSQFITLRPMFTGNLYSTYDCDFQEGIGVVSWGQPVRCWNPVAHNCVRIIWVGHKLLKDTVHYTCRNYVTLN